MKISEIKAKLEELESVDFRLENGHKVPSHFHVTEVGEVTKHFIDCGGTVRHEKKANFQLWNANDFDHRLKPLKLLNIIELSEKVLGLGDLEIEVEYQAETIGKYELDIEGSTFVLKAKQTDCLASDSCGISADKQRIKLSDLQMVASEPKASCTPGGGCC